MDTLKVSFIQSDLVWENTKANLNNFEEKIKTISSDIDLIILPEMFTTGFSMNAKVLAEDISGRTVQWMQKIAISKDCAITGSIIIKEDDIYFNRLIFMYPSGEFKHYDKRHTFTLANEHKAFTAGNKKVILDYRGWKICPLICYDLRFPAWARNQENYNLLIYIASWPKKRIAAWDALLKARAIENMSYTIGVNRIGKDGNDYEYVGHSIIYDALGNNITEPNNKVSCVISVELDKNKQNTTRNSLGFLNDKDSFIIQ